MSAPPCAGLCPTDGMFQDLHPGERVFEGVTYYGLAQQWRTCQRVPPRACLSQWTHALGVTAGAVESISVLSDMLRISSDFVLTEDRCPRGPR